MNTNVSVYLCLNKITYCLSKQELSQTDTLYKMTTFSKNCFMPLTNCTSCRNSTGAVSLGMNMQRGEMWDLFPKPRNLACDVWLLPKRWLALSTLESPFMGDLSVLVGNVGMKEEGTLASLCSDSVSASQIFVTWQFLKFSGFTSCESLYIFVGSKEILLLYQYVQGIKTSVDRFGIYW